jgi:hypothetical protein
VPGRRKCGDSCQASDGPWGCSCAPILPLSAPGVSYSRRPFGQLHTTLRSCNTCAMCPLIVSARQNLGECTCDASTWCGLGWLRQTATTGGLTGRQRGGPGVRYRWIWLRAVRTAIQRIGVGTVDGAAAPGACTGRRWLGAVRLGRCGCVRVRCVRRPVCIVWEAAVPPRIARCALLSRYCAIVPGSPTPSAIVIDPWWRGVADPSTIGGYGVEQE